MYICPAGLPTIGYGTVIDSPEEQYLRYKTLSESEAETLLKKEVAHFEKGVKRLVKSRINQSQFDALVSFAYNCGLSNLQKSTLLKKVNQNPDDISIPHEFEKWVYANGKVLPGLEKRRNAEANLYKL